MTVGSSLQEHTHGLASSSGRNKTDILPLAQFSLWFSMKSRPERTKELLSSFPDDPQGDFSLVFRKQMERRSSADLSSIDKTD